MKVDEGLLSSLYEEAKAATDAAAAEFAEITGVKVNSAPATACPRRA